MQHLLPLLALVGLFLACGVIYAILALIDSKDRWKNDKLSGITGISQWRIRLNGITRGFVELGKEPLLERAVSNTADPQADRLRGDTLTRYRTLKVSYTALSFAYNGASRIVQKAENLLSANGLWKAVTIRRAIKSFEQPVMIKEINPASFVVSLPSGSPKTPLYQPGYLFDVCERLINDIRTNTQAIKDAPGKVQTRLGKVENDLATCEQQRQALKQKGIDLTLFKDRRDSIEVVRGQVNASLGPDPFGAVKRCDELDKQVQSLQNELNQANSVYAKLQAAQQALIACEAQNAALAQQQIAYSPYKDRVSSIDNVRKQVEGAVGMDPARALNSCAELEKQLKGLAQELSQAATVVASLSASELDLAAKKERVTKIRATAVTCPWSEARAGEELTWTLATPDSNPDRFFEQSQSLLTQARNSLSSGNFPVIANEIKQAETVRNQAMTMVQALFDAKTSVDEKVPRVRAELSKLHTEVSAITNVDNEMSAVMKRACAAIEDRLTEIRVLYGKQKFAEAASLLTGNAGSEHGMPISKLMEQAQELCKILKQAAEVAGKVQAQLGTK